MQIGKDKVVTIDYTLTDDKGKVIDSSKGQEPLAYLHGSGNVIPGLEKALEGKSAGEKLNVVVPPDQAYGAHNPAMVQDVPLTAFGKSKVEAGMQFRAESQGGGARLVTIVSVKDDAAVVDANHPLAGQTLHFDVNIISVRAATKEETSHGHVHGPGGHHH